MASHLWKVTAKRDNGKVKKGMSTELIVKNSSRKPTSEEIANALNKKYHEDIPKSAVSVSLFELDEIK